METAENPEVNTSTNLTEEEATRYDRQMRLWGIEAQQRHVSCLLSSQNVNCIHIST